MKYLQLGIDVGLHQGSRHYFICAAPVMMDRVEKGNRLASASL